MTCAHWRSFPRWVLVLVLIGSLVGTPPAGAAPVAVVYQPPVPGPLLRAFEEPPHRFAAGHRGLDLAVTPDEPVRAAAAGTVTFAGPVAGEVWVTVVHADGIRTSYGALTDLQVAAGTVVAAGEVLGRATGWHRSASPAPDRGLHLGARRGEDHIDPATLFARPAPRASLVGPGRWWGSDPVVAPYAPYEPGRWFATASPVAERPGFALPPNHHHAVLVPGFGTEGPHELFTPEHLGYGEQDVSRFSYAGCDPTPDGCTPRSYGGRDTHLDVADAAARLRDHLQGRQRAQPWRPVDLLGHSMGGDVITYYLEHLHDPDDPSLPPIGAAVTYGTPHRGSGVARVGRALSDSVLGAAVGEGALWLARTAGVEGADRLALDVPPVRRYGGWRPPSRDPERLEELGVELHTFAGSRDLVVAPRRAAPAGTSPTVLPGSHSGMLRTEALLGATHAALSGGRPVGADGGLVGVGPSVVDGRLRDVALVVDGAELLFKGRVVRLGVAGVRRLLTGEKDPVLDPPAGGSDAPADAPADVPADALAPG